MQKLIKTSNIERERLRDIMLSLSGFAKSFRNTGNSYVANELEYLAADVSIVEKNFGKVVGETIKEEYLKAQHYSSNVLNAALAGATVATEPIQKS